MLASRIVETECAVTITQVKRGRSGSELTLVRQAQRAVWGYDVVERSADVERQQADHRVKDQQTWRRFSTPGEMVSALRPSGPVKNTGPATKRLCKPRRGPGEASCFRLSLREPRDLSPTTALACW